MGGRVAPFAVSMNVEWGVGSRRRISWLPASPTRWRRWLLRGGWAGR